jgi:hypothetical protein
MPKGVEHYNNVILRESEQVAKGSVMPKGVEHF